MHERIQNILEDIEKSGEKVRNINVFLNDPGTTVVINYSKGEGRQTEPIDLVRHDQLDQTLNTLAARARVEGSGVPFGDVPQQGGNREPTDSGHVSPNLQNPCPTQGPDKYSVSNKEDLDCDDDDNDDIGVGGEEEKEEDCDSAAAASDDDNDDDGGDDDDNDGDGFENAKNNNAVPPQKPLHTDDDDNGDDVDIEFDDDDACHKDDDDDDEEEEDATQQRTIAAALNSHVSRLMDDDNCDNDEEEENVVGDEDDYGDNDEEEKDKDDYGDDYEKGEEKENVGKDKDEFCDDDDEEEKENMVEDEDDDDDDENDDADDEEEDDDDEDDGDAAVNNDEHDLSSQCAKQRVSPNVATRGQIYKFVSRLGSKQVAQIWKWKFRTVASQRERSADKRYQHSQKHAARGGSINEERHSCSSGEANEQSTRLTKHTPFNTKTTLVEETSDEDESRFSGKDSESSERAKESEPEELDKNSEEYWYIRDMLYDIKTECTREEFAHNIRDPTRNKKVYRVVQSKNTYPDARDLYFNCVYDDIIVSIPYTKRSDYLYYSIYCKLYGSWWHHAHKTEASVIDSTHPLYARVIEKATASVDFSLQRCQAYHPLPSPPSANADRDGK